MNRTKKIPVAAERQPESLLLSLCSANWYWGLLLVLSTILAYQLAWHAGFIWDDDRYVTQNKLLTAKLQQAANHYDYVFKMKVLEFYKGQGIKL